MMESSMFEIEQKLLGKSTEGSFYPQKMIERERHIHREKLFNIILFFICTCYYLLEKETPHNYISQIDGIRRRGWV